MRHKGNKFSRRHLSKAAMREKLYDSRYLVPTIVTLGNMFFGFMSIIYATSGRFKEAAWAIIVAMIFDGCDGRVARSFKATSKFGLELDSLSDLVSFGVAPAILVYQWCFKETADEFGVIVCFAYCIGAAARLARFNITECNLKSFEGMPSPAAAGFVASIVCVLQDYIPQAPWERGLAAFLMVFVGYLMISKIEYFSLKQLKFKHMPFYSILLAGVAIALAWYAKEVFSVIVFVGYALSALILAVMKMCSCHKCECVEDAVCQEEGAETPFEVAPLAEEPKTVSSEVESEKKDFTLD